MSLELFTQFLAALALALAVIAFGQQLRALNRLARPVERSIPKGNVSTGIRYAFTWGMAPWAKESTRQHFAAYVRGMAFHLAIFLGLALLLVSPGWYLLPFAVRVGLAAFTGLGAVFGLIGFIARFVERTLKALSTPDDYFAVVLVSLFLANASVALTNLAWLPILYVVSAVMLVYAPLGKIRHCIYYAYSRWFFGKLMGHCAVLLPGKMPHARQTEVSR